MQGKINQIIKQIKNDIEKRFNITVIGADIFDDFEETIPSGTIVIDMSGINESDSDQHDESDVFTFTFDFYYFLKYDKIEELREKTVDIARFLNKNFFGRMLLNPMKVLSAEPEYTIEVKTTANSVWKIVAEADILFNKEDINDNNE